MYACGPTVYNPPHIGNARAAVVYDIAYRVLMRHYENVVYARNITDVDDKINAAAASQGVSISEVTERYISIYHEDMSALGLLSPTIEPRATAHISSMLDMIQRLIDDHYAYVADDHVLFSVDSFPAYGALSGRSRSEMIAGARVEIAPYKRDPADFVLWKPSPTELPGWDSPWGRGRPGWHIECSAMVAEHLGTTIDIHGGGNDLKFPHHENEIAQSRCAHNQAPLSRYWIHNGFVEFDSEKMSKSIGNVLLVRELIEEYPAEAIRLALIRTKYREPLNWNDTVIKQAKSELDRMYGALERLTAIDLDDIPPTPIAFNEAMDDDLNTPKAISVLMGVANTANRAKTSNECRRLKGELLAGGYELGVLQQNPTAWFSRGREEVLDTARIEALITEREVARGNKDWATADSIRDQLAGLGVEINDSPSGTQWRVG